MTKSIKQIRRELKESKDTHLTNMEKVLSDEQIALLMNSITCQAIMKLLEEE